MNTSKIRSISTELEELYGKEGTPEREAFRAEAYSYYLGQVLRDVRKTEEVAQLC